MRYLAQFISIVTNPLVIAFPSAYALVYKTSLNSNYSLHWAFYSLLFSGFVAVFVLYGIRQKFFSDIDVSRKSQRNKLFVFVIIIAIAYFFTILIVNGPKVLLVALLSILISTAVAGMVNTRVKASMHVAVFSCFVYTLAFLYGGVFLYGIFFIPVVAWARVVVKRHTRRETIAGAALGLVLITILLALFSLQGMHV